MVKTSSTRAEAWPTRRRYPSVASASHRRLRLMDLS
jgi:hypothetical protein